VLPARLVATILLLTSAIAAAGCQFPRDTADTLNNVSGGGTLRVGITESEPWVSLRSGEPSGVEIGLIREFAARIGARVDYTTGPEEELVETLRRRELDVVLGGITDKTVWKKEVGMTKPYLTTHLVVGMPEGEDLADGTKVAVENGTSAAALLESKTNAIPVPRETLRRGEPAVADEWLLDDLGLVEAKSLAAEEHVMLVSPGENAFMVALERFLLDRRDRALELLEQEGRP
jgi:polar amino acid transport system substrate-binding protein